MRPRRHIFHHSEPPPPPPASAYQSMNHNSRIIQVSSPPEQSMAPPPPLPMGHHSAGPSATPPQPDFIAELIRLGLNPEDMMSSKQPSNSRQQQGQEEVLKNIQALLGKRDVAEFIQKLPNEWSSMTQQPPSDYSRVASGSSTSGGNPGNRDSVIRGPAPMFAPAGGGGGSSGSGSGVVASGAVSFTNNINNNGNSSHQEQDTQYANVHSHQQQQQQQQFRIPTTNSSNATVQNSPYYRQMPTGSQSEQMKSIFSRYRHLQQQQRQQQLNDSPHRNRLSHHQQQQNISNSSAAPNLPFANLNDLGGSVHPTAAAASGSGGASTILDTSNNLTSIFSHQTNKTSPALSSYTIASGGGSSGSGSMAPRVPTNLMDALSSASVAGSSSGVGISGDTNGPTSGIDINMHDNSPFQLSGSIINNNNINNSIQRDNMKQKSIARHHQQLRGQLRANNDKLKNYPWPNQQGVSSSSLSHGGGGDMQLSNQQPRSNQSNNNTESMSQMRRQLTSPLASAISPPNQVPTAAPSSSSVPKSLLNLAAFSTSPPATNNINAVTSNPRMTTNQVPAAHRNSSMAANQVYGSGVDATFSNNRQQQQQQQSAARTCNTAGSSPLMQKASPSSSGDPSTNNQLLQQMIARSSTKTNPNIASRTNYSNYSLSSLLSDDQSGTGTRGNVSANNINRATVVGQPNPIAHSRIQNPAVISNMRWPPSAKSDDAITAMPESKDLAKIAFLEESIKRAKTVDAAGSSQAQSLDLAANSTQYDRQVEAMLYDQQQHSNSGNLNTNEVMARKEIESALKRVENRNDLSLLYPPISLSSNSQKQVNSLSAGLQLPEDVDVFTDEVKKIVQEGCNIIYECKTCCNLFRSLANLVKHKRTFCKSEENQTAAARFELTRRANMSALQSVDLSVTKSNPGSSGAPTRPGMVQSSEGPINVSRVEVPTHHHASNRATRSIVQQLPASQSQPSPSLGSQKYNLRGKRVDVSALTGEMRAPRMPARNSDTRHTNVSGNQAEGRQTNLSRLLQSQPRNRPSQVVKDSPLMEALSMGASTATSTIAPPSRSHDSTFYQDHVRGSSLAKTLLSESAKSLSADQSTHIMARETNNNMQQSSSKRPTGPKRKLLEDCIRKVKRDKLGPDEDPGLSQESDTIVSDQQQQQLRESAHNQFRDPLEMDDSGADSDALVMDLDDDHYGAMHETRRTKSRARTSSMHASQSNSKLNSSSALLKALTRPVESRSTYGLNNQQKKETGSARHTRPQDATGDVKDGHQPDSALTSDSQAGAQAKPAAASAATPPSPIMSHCSCNLCEQSFGDPSNLIDHIFEEHSNKEKHIYPCIFCSLSFIALENVCRHMVDIHKKSKTQVNKLKDVVQLRSHVSDDFENCDDVPAERKTGSKISPKLRLSPGALSDSAATQQILDDTVALVSMAASPTKLTPTHSPTKKEAVSTLATRSSARLSAGEPDAPEESEGVQSEAQEQTSSKINVEDSEQGSQSGLEIDDRLSDSMIPSISDEQLAILEREEAEIEAERLRREEEGLHLSAENPSDAEDDLNDESEQDNHRQSLHPQSSSQEESSVQESASSYDSQNWRDGYRRSATKNDSCGKAIVANEPPSRRNNDDDDEDDDEEEDDELEVDQSTHGSNQQGRVSRGKHMIPPVRLASDEEDEEEEEEDDDDDDDENDDEADDLDERRLVDVDDNDDEDVEDNGDQGEVDSELAVDNDDDEEDENSWSVPEEGSTSYPNHQSATNDLPSSQPDDHDSDDEIEVESHRSRRGHHHRVTPRRRSSHGSSTKGDHNPELYHNNQHETNDKTANYDHDDVRASSAAGPRYKHKHGASRDTPAGLGGASSASSSGGGGTGGATTPGSSSGGGIMKLKIQLKKQPDEKNQVYRIVE